MYVTPSAINEADAGAPANIASAPEIAASHEELQLIHLTIPVAPLISDADGKVLVRTPSGAIVSRACDAQMNVL
jgi:hypothetical protein